MIIDGQLPTRCPVCGKEIAYWKKFCTEVCRTIFIKTFCETATSEVIGAENASGQ